MTMPLYVPPEQVIKDRADFARRGVSRGRPAVVISGREGILLAAVNSSQALCKLSEIYDKIAFAAVGKWSEFEALRVAGIRYADMRGYSYNRSDVTGRGLAGAYAQTIAAAFISDPKPLEVELVVAQVGHTQADDAVFHIKFDGAVSDDFPWAVLGGAPALAVQELTAQWRPGLTRTEMAALARAVLGSELGSGLEVAWLQRGRDGRAFERLPNLH
jgi:proteasome alpha subunit